MLTVHHKNKSYDVRVERSSRKTVALQVTPEGALVVRSPYDFHEDNILEFVGRKMGWVLKKLREIADMEPALPARKFIPGESHYFLGKQYMLEVEYDDTERVELRRDRLVVHQSERGRTETRRIFQEWQRAQMEKVFSVRYARMGKRFSYSSLPRLEIKLMQKRWGSYRLSGSIALNEKLIHAPIEAIDYVIIHELCHHKHADHSKEYYTLLSRVLPGWKEEKKRLERYGALMA